MNSSRKGRIMTDRSDAELPADQAPVERTPGGPGPGGDTEHTHGSQDATSQAQRSSPGAAAQGDDSRSGADVREAVDTAESGTEAQGDHSHPELAKSGEAPVEQVFDDPAMTEGQRTGTGSPVTTGAVPPGPSPADAGSGGAQSVVGARESDRLAAGERPASGAPFETGTDDPEAEAGPQP